MQQGDWVAGIPDREIHEIGCPVAEHLFFATEKDYGSVGRQMAIFQTAVQATNLYFLDLTGFWGIAAGPGEIWELGVFQGSSASSLSSIGTSHSHKAAREFIFPTIPVHGAMVFDDDGWASCSDVREAVDECFAERPEVVFSLPITQAQVVKVAA